MATFNHAKHLKLSIALEIIIDNGYGVRRGMYPSELLILDATNEIKAIVFSHKDDENGWDFVHRADLIREFSKLGVVLK